MKRYCKKKFVFKGIALVITVAASLLLSSCSSLGFGTVIPTSELYTAFENDTWLVIDNFLINKDNGKVCLFEPDYDAAIPGIDNIYYHGPYTYKLVFETSELKQYTFLQTNFTSNETGELIYQFYDCVFTYNYEGQELNRLYISAPLTEEQVKELYKTNVSATEAFSFEIDMLWKQKKTENTSSTKQTILEFAETIYENQSERHSTVIGTAKPMSNSTWFSIVLSKDSHYNSGAPLLQGIHTSEIKSYNPDSNQFETVFEYNQKGKTIVDFDEYGIYTFDSKGNLNYMDFESRESTLIHTFPSKVYGFWITEGYICANYGNDSEGCFYFVYQKGESIITDDIYEEY